MRPSAGLVLLSIATPVLAHGVSNEIIVNSAQSSQSASRAGVFTDSLFGSYALDEDWTILASASVTLLGGTDTANSAGFDHSDSPLTRFSAGAERSIADRWTIGLTFDVSPASTQFSVASVPGTGALGEIRSEVSQFGAGVDVYWDSFGTSDLEWSFGGGIDFSHSSIVESIPRVVTASGQPLTPAQFAQQYCASRPRARNCARILLDALSGTQRTLDFERLSGGVTATLFRDTELSLIGDYYVYNQDPDVLDYRTATLAGGAGFPIAPLQFLVRPEILHRFGDLSARLWFEAGSYVPGTGQSTTGLGLRLQYKLSKAFRAWVSGAGRRDVDDLGFAIQSVTVSAGVGYRW